MSLDDTPSETTDDTRIDKIKDVAETVGVSVAVVASETWDKARDLAGEVGHKIADLAEDLKDKVSGHADDEDSEKSA